MSSKSYWHHILLLFGNLMAVMIPLSNSEGNGHGDGLKNLAAGSDTLGPHSKGFMKPQNLNTPSCGRG